MRQTADRIGRGPETRLDSATSTGGSREETDPTGTSQIWILCANSRGSLCRSAAPRVCPSCEMLSREAGMYYFIPNPVRCQWPPLKCPHWTAENSSLMAPHRNISSLLLSKGRVSYSCTTPDTWLSDIKYLKHWRPQYFPTHHFQHFTILTHKTFS